MEEGGMDANDLELIRCSKENDLAGLQLVLGDGEVDVNCRDKDGMSALIYAAFHGHFDACKCLLEAGADINAKSNKGAYPALLAVLKKHIQLAKYLIDQGADISGPQAQIFTKFLNWLKQGDGAAAGAAAMAAEAAPISHEPDDTEIMCEVLGNDTVAKLRRNPKLFAPLAVAAQIQKSFASLLEQVSVLEARVEEANGALMKEQESHRETLKEVGPAIEKLRVSEQENSRLKDDHREVVEDLKGQIADLTWKVKEKAMAMRLVASAPGTNETPPPDAISTKLPKTPSLLTLAGVGKGFKDGDSKTAKFSYPCTLCLPPRSASKTKGPAKFALFVTDKDNGSIRCVDMRGNVSSVIVSQEHAGLPEAKGAALIPGTFSPRGFAMDVESGNAYVADLANHKIWKVDMKEGRVQSFAGGGEGFQDGQGENASFNCPCALAIDYSGKGGVSIVVCDLLNKAIRRVSSSGAVTTVLGPNRAKGVSPFKFPCGVCVDTNGSIYVADQDANAIFAIGADGKSRILAGGRCGMQDGIGAEARFNLPSGVAVDDSGNLYVADAENASIRVVYIHDGQVSTLVTGTGLQDLNESDEEASPLGFGSAKAQASTFSSPSDVAVDTATGMVYISDHFQHKVFAVPGRPAVGRVTAIASKRAANAPSLVAGGKGTREAVLEQELEMALSEIRRLRDANLRLVAKKNAAITNAQAEIDKLRSTERSLKEEITKSVKMSTDAVKMERLQKVLNSEWMASTEKIRVPGCPGLAIFIRTIDYSFRELNDPHIVVTVADKAGLIVSKSVRTIAPRGKSQQIIIEREHKFNRVAKKLLIKAKRGAEIAKNVAKQKINQYRNKRALKRHNKAGDVGELVIQKEKEDPEVIDQFLFLCPPAQDEKKEKQKSFFIFFELKHFKTVSNRMSSRCFTFIPFTYDMLSCGSKTHYLPLYNKPTEWHRKPGRLHRIEMRGELIVDVQSYWSQN